jgi:hypothetical protein
MRSNHQLRDALRRLPVCHDALELRPVAFRRGSEVSCWIHGTFFAVLRAIDFGTSMPAIRLSGSVQGG